MPIVAYLANQFPSPVEPYVADEIRELRRRGVTVIASSARQATSNLDASMQALRAETLYLLPLGVMFGVRAGWTFLRRFALLGDLIAQALVCGNENPNRRLRALLHTWLGVCYALLLRDRGVEHIHVHHGYFGAWIAMVAARLLDIPYSFTLHGSDLLLHPAWMELKLKNCAFCLTISEFNRQHILHRYPKIDRAKIFVQRLGATRSHRIHSPVAPATQKFTLLAVGRLHPVKDHDFLLRACSELNQRSVDFICLIAGDGPERHSLKKRIFDLGLCGQVHLLGQLSPLQLDVCYRNADLCVLTSRNEGIPLVLMEAMSRCKPVLAPNITGIPELVIDGQTGFLYRPGAIDDFVNQVENIRASLPALSCLREAARKHVLQHFDREKNLARFSDVFITHIARQ